MLVQNVSLSNQNYRNSCNFKSVYPVYHWLEFNGKYKPAVKQMWVQRCQRILAALLNKAGCLDLDNPGKSVLHNTAYYVASVDKDYKFAPLVRSFYNNSGGFKNTPEARSIVPMSYLVTGCDATEFERIFGKPLRTLKNHGCSSQEAFEASKQRAKVSYELKGKFFIESKYQKFVDKETGKPLELHTIFERTGEQKNPLKIIKCSFYIQGDKNNPLITNGIIDP